MNESHVHDVLETEEHESMLFHWSSEQTAIIKSGVEHHAKPNVIRRNLEESGAFGHKLPTQIQLYNKIASVKRSIFPSTKINTTYDLIQKIENT